MKRYIDYILTLAIIFTLFLLYRQDRAIREIKTIQSFALFTDNGKNEKKIDAWLEAQKIAFANKN